MGKSLTPDEIKAITTIAAEVALNEFKKEIARQDKERRDKKIRNVKLLLKNYRRFKKHAAGVEEKIEDVTATTFLYQKDLNELIVPAILKSKQRTNAIIRFMDKMLEVYKADCEESGKPEAVRRFKVIEMAFLNEVQVSNVTIQHELNISDTTMYEDIKKAREELAVYLFGIDVIEIKDVG